MGSDLYFAVFDSEAYLMAEGKPAEGQLELLENLETDYESEEGYIVCFEDAEQAGAVNTEDVLEEVYSENPRAFAFLDGEVREGVEEEIGEDSSIFAKDTVARRLVDEEEYDWRNTDLSGTKIVVGENPEDVWSSYNISARTEPSLDLGLPRDNVGVKSD